MTDHVELRTGIYVDSVSLMQVSRQVAAATGVDAAQVAMATELNLDVLRGMGFAVPQTSSPNDLVVALRAADDSGVAAGRAAVDEALAALRSAGSSAMSSTGGFGAAPAPRTLGRAIDAVAANLALVSVPGRHAAVEALDAIDRGVSVMLFSDNVDLETEVLLKLSLIHI